MLFGNSAALRVLRGQPVPAPLFNEEKEAAVGMGEQRRSEFALGRQCARMALAALGVPPISLPRGLRGAPVWPAGYIGSISHCDDFYCAVAGKTSDVIGLGIDVERIQPIEPELTDLICVRDETRRLSALTKVPGVDWANIFFSAKEAVYKCLFPLHGTFLEFGDISLALSVNASRSGGNFCVVELPSLTTDVRLDRLLGRWTVGAGFVLAGIAAVTSVDDCPRVRSAARHLRS
ncbi:4'-phosphopantetheinyl transferase [Bradyrhizobium sp. SZCCHNR3015]|uniref:4'-phosphopantetheinyl transferase family protein n=1 Tax=Bradyrhizobium sp. SZCCHNR3015 TaxID=3057395 RepID=UPI002915ECB9|nr:4'-phosphopantetheinyl transferase superfamily protein [Bradyrhizobium sp. SZCCHNR3015]